MTPRSATRLPIWMLASLLMLGEAACTSVTSLPVVAASSISQAPTTPMSIASVEQQVHTLVNRHRASRGLSPLAWDKRLANVARRHSQDMAAGRVPFSHDGFDERSEAADQWFEVRAFAENVAYNSRPNVAAAVVQRWLNSPGHRTNIEGDFDVAGVGVAQAPDGTFYFTQIFVAQQ